MSRAYIERGKFGEQAKAGESVDGILRKQYVAEIRALEPDAASASRSRTFVVSTGSVDRDNDVISPAGWHLDNYRKNPVVLFAHDYMSLPIGRCTSIELRDGQLVATAEFADHAMADTCLKLIDGGFLSATSVGFRPLTYAYNETRSGIDFQEQELLEFSVVPVPANPEALIVARELQGDVESLKAWARKTLQVLEPEPEVKRDLLGPKAPKKTGADKVAEALTARLDAMAESLKALEAKLATKDVEDPVVEPKAETPMCSSCGMAMTAMPGATCANPDTHVVDNAPVAPDGDERSAAGEAVAKRGRVLSAKNEAAIRSAKGLAKQLDDALESVLIQLAREPEPDDNEDDPSEEDGEAAATIEIAEAETVASVIELADEPVVEKQNDDAVIDLVEAAAPALDGALIRSAVGDVLKDLSIGELVRSEIESAMRRARGMLD